MPGEGGTRRAVVRIGRVAGIPVLLAPSWFVFAVFILLTSGRALRSHGIAVVPAYAAGVSFALLLLLSVLLHEIGHALVARGLGLPVSSITVTLLAGLTEIPTPPRDPTEEYAVAISGPMVSLLLAAGGVAATGLFEAQTLPRLLCQGVALTNGLVAAFNLLPGLPLDGGRVLRSAVWRWRGDAELATRVGAWSGRVVALIVVPVVLVGVLPAAGLGDRSTQSLVFAALVGGFIYAGATATLRRSQLIGRLPGVTVDLLARPALAIPARTPLAEAVRQAHEAGARALVVTDSAGTLEGVVSESWVRQVPAERRPWVSVADGARRLEAGLLLPAGLVGEDLLAFMRTTPASEYVVPGSPPRVVVSADVAAAMAR